MSYTANRNIHEDLHAFLQEPRNIREIADHFKLDDLNVAYSRLNRMEDYLGVSVRSAKAIGQDGVVIKFYCMSQARLDELRACTKYDTPGIIRALDERPRLTSELCELFNVNPGVDVYNMIKRVSLELPKRTHIHTFRLGPYGAVYGTNKAKVKDFGLNFQRQQSEAREAQEARKRELAYETTVDASGEKSATLREGWVEVIDPFADPDNNVVSVFREDGADRGMEP